MSPQPPVLTPEVESLLSRIDHALSSAEGMALMISDNEPADPTAHARPGYNVQKISVAMMALSQHGRRLLNELRQQYLKVTLH
ncbi:hypothetical protein IAE57_01955 [Stenotrophomonas sp. S48]|uniref:hypothetical protein n=1 Tax=unclassified Stenotrophomonas TaxID=196198 RepID=UPI001900189F|nr:MULTISPECIES: hypothetical protein [unclassified Stenotrophomonas]MBK0024915.1 hypothetical protein [Stenotrophomonas sp. S48]MBK0047155.1 hypothetical protein [Stenotrophomonas sp. S49]